MKKKKKTRWLLLLEQQKSDRSSHCSSRISLLAFYSSEEVLSAQVRSLDKDKAGSAKVNESGHVKKN